MKISDHTILITGGGSGIGRGLAEAFHAAGHQVVISGRRAEVLDETTAANPGMKSLTVDMTDPASIRAFAGRLAEQFPQLDVVINNAGIMRPESVREQGQDLSDAEATITTNLLGPIRLNAALLPGLLAQPAATIINVSSGLAFVPMAMTPTYSATKAAIHSYSQALRHQLRDTSVEVIELIPPYVATTLMGEHQAQDPNAMPLEDFIREVMEILGQPGVTEVCVEKVLPLRFAAEGGPEKYAQVFNGLQQMVEARKS